MPAADPNDIDAMIREAEDLTIWLCRNPDVAAALDRWLNSPDGD